MTEVLGAETVVCMLHTFFSEMTTSIEGNQGIVDKYLGDGIMAIWNHPYDTVTNHAIKACTAALAMHQRTEVLSALWQEQYQRPPFQIRIGINTGQALVGNIGSTTRLNFTAIGDSINIASRLEDLNKVFKSHILLSFATYSQVKHEFLCTFTGFVTLKGRTTPSDVYILEKPLQAATAHDLNVQKRLLAVRDMIQERQYQAALELCADLIEMYPQREHVSILSHQIEQMQSKKNT